MSRTLALTLLILAATGGIGFGGDRRLSGGSDAAQCPVGGCFAANDETFSTGQSGPVYAFSHEFDRRTLTRVDPKTLQPAGKRLRLPKDAETESFSPSGEELLLSLGNEFPAEFPSFGIAPRTPTRLMLVDLRTMQIEPGAGRRLSARLALADRIVWPRPDVIVGQTDAGVAIGIDPHSGALRWKRQHIVPEDRLAADGTLVAVSYDRERGTAVVQTLAPSGLVRVSRAVAVPAIGGEHRTPRLVLTAGRSGPHAYLLIGGGRVYTIDLGTVGLTRHDVSAPPGLPLQSSSGIEFLWGAPLGDRIVVSGFFQGPRGGAAVPGLYLIDPVTWTARTLDRSTPPRFTTGTALVTYTRTEGETPAEWRTRGTGITVYDSTGALRHHLLGRQSLEGVALAPEFQLAIVALPAKACRPVRTFCVYPDTNFRWDTAAGFQAAAATTAKQTRQVLYDPISGKTLGTRTEPAFTDLIGPHLDFAGYAD